MEKCISWRYLSLVYNFYICQLSWNVEKSFCKKVKWWKQKRGGGKCAGIRSGGGVSWKSFRAACFRYNVIYYQEPAEKSSNSFFPPFSAHHILLNAKRSNLKGKTVGSGQCCRHLPSHHCWVRSYHPFVWQSFVCFRCIFFIIIIHIFKMFYPMFQMYFT